MFHIELERSLKDGTITRRLLMVPSFVLLSANTASRIAALQAE